MRKRGRCCCTVLVCLSVCHVGFLDCIHTAEDIVKLLIRPGKPITLVFDSPCADTHFKRNTISGAAKYTGVGKLAILD